MKQEMLINAVHAEQKRMAIVENGKLVDFNIQMTVREPITGNIYKGIVQKVERGLQAAFVNYGGSRDGFLPLRDVSSDYVAEAKENGRHGLKSGQEILVQVLREVSERKGALLTAYISLPGRYLVLMPKKQSSGISRKIEDEAERKHLKELVSQIQIEDDMGFIVRTAGMNRTKQELSRDYQHLLRLWREIVKRTETTAAPALIYQESDFGVRSLRDYFTSEIEEIWVDDVETFRKMRAYCKAVAPRNMKMIKMYKDIRPIFDQHQLEDQIRAIYQEKVDLKSGGYILIKPTEAMITIDVNSGRASNKRNVEETAFRANIEAAEEIARQLRLRDLGGLIVVDFIDMEDQKHNAEVEKTFKKALSVDRARIQLAHISKFGILELSRQKKQSTIQEISYNQCPFCRGTGVRPSLEYTALGAFRKVVSQAVKRTYASLRVTMPYEVCTYLSNQKRGEIHKLETLYDMSIHLSGSPEMAWDEIRIESLAREAPPETVADAEESPARKAEGAGEAAAIAAVSPGQSDGEGDKAGKADARTAPKKGRRRPRHRRKKTGSREGTGEEAAASEENPGEGAQTRSAEGEAPATDPPKDPRPDPAVPAAAVPDEDPEDDRGFLFRLIKPF